MREVKAGTTVDVGGDGPPASSCALVVTQPTGTPAGWRVRLYARFPVGDAFVGEVALTGATAGPKTRVAAVATIPGASGFHATIDGDAIAATSPAVQVALYQGEATALGAGVSSVSP